MLLAGCREAGKMTGDEEARVMQREGKRRDGKEPVVKKRILVEENKRFERKAFDFPFHLSYRYLIPYINNFLYIQNVLYSRKYVLYSSRNALYSRSVQCRCGLTQTLANVQKLSAVLKRRTDAMPAITISVEKGLRVFFFRIYHFTDDISMCACSTNVL